MKRKIYSILAMLLLLVCGVNAQVHESLKQKGKHVQVGNALANFETDTWYFLHQSREGGSNGGAGTHSLVGGLPQTGGFMWDAGVGVKAKKSEVTVVKDITEDASTMIEDAAKYIVRFLDGAEEGSYIIQFGTGNYLNDDLNITASKADACDMNIYLINADEQKNAEGEVTVEAGVKEGHIALNKWNMGSRLDNNGAGNPLAWWGSGELHAINGNNDWAIHEVVFVEVDEREAAIANAIAVQLKYQDLSENFVAGTEPGQYDADALAALKAAIEAIDELDSPDAEFYTLEQIEALAKAVVDAYNACVATLVHFTVPDGYYHIVSAMTWTKTETIPAEVEGGEPTTVETHPIKAIYVDGQNAKWGDYEPDNCTFLWKFEQTPAHNFKIYNAAMDGGFNNIATSAGVTMADTATVMRFVTLRKTDEGKYVVGFTGEKQTGAQQYAHCGGHGGGAGNGGNIVGWGVGDIGASEWLLEEVSAEDAAAIIAAYEPIKNHELLVAQYDSIKANAIEKLELTRDKYTNLHEDQPLVTDATQFYSPNTTTDLQCENVADVYPYLLDGNAGTYWHSAWEGGNVAGGTHYLQVELPEGSETLATAAIKFTRRAVANDHITVWGVYGTNVNDAEAAAEEKVAKADCEELAVLETPFGSNTETVVSEVFPVKGYKYIRFYINNTVGSGINATRGYGHVSEFQVYPAEAGQRDPNQYTMMGNIATDLEAVLAAQADLEAEDVDVAAFTALKNAYDAFIAIYTDPAPLRAKLAEVAEVASIIKVGTNPGEWANGSAGDALLKAIADATAYDLAAKYTPEQSKKWIADLTAAAEAVPASANQIKTGKWYKLRFGTEAEYEANGWDKGPASDHEIKKDDEVTEYHAELFGKYLAVGLSEEDGISHSIRDLDPSDVAVGNRVYLIDKEELEVEGSSLWRFVNVGDTAYVVQNKATGLYLRAAGTSGAVTMSVHPSLMSAPKAIGYGQCLTPVRALTTGAKQSYLHVQRDGNFLVTWDNPAAGSNSGLFIEEAEDVAADYVGKEFNLKVQKGEIAAYCYPVAITCTQADAVMYGVSVNGTDVTLNPLADNKVEAGEPFILIYGTPEDYVEGTEEAPAVRELITMEHGDKIVAAPGTLGALVGALDGSTIGAGKILCEGNEFNVTKKSNTKVGGNSAYINTAFDVENGVPTLNVTIDGKTFDSIEEAVAAVAKIGNIYTIDGRLVGKGNVNTLRQLGRGIYIVNGAKVTVK